MTNRRIFILSAASAALAKAATATAPSILLPGGESKNYEDPRLSGLGTFSVLLSFHAGEFGRDTVLLNCPGRWQLRLHAAGLLSAITYYSATRFQSSEITQIIAPDSWYQLGIALDLAAKRLRFVFRQPGPQQDWATGEFRILPGTLGPETPPSDRLLLDEHLGRTAIYDRALTLAELRDSLEAFPPPPPASGLSIASCTFPRMRDPGVQLPAPSDVPMSSRSWHPHKPGDPNDTLRDLKAFHATRLEWIYDSSPEHILAVTSAGLAFCTTINATDELPGRPYSGRNFDGGVAFFSWMASWTHDEGPVGACCVNNERFQAHQRDVIAAAVREGAAGVQYDDWASNLSFAANNGECFCEFCLRKFRSSSRVDYREYLQQKGVGDLRGYLEYRKRSARDPLQQKYVQFQTDSIREHLGDLKRMLASLNAPGGKRPSLSVNANFTSAQSRAMAASDAPDYFVGEGGDETLAGMFLNAKIAEALQRTTIFSPFPFKVDVTRSEIALQYALGQLCLVPYDIWMRTSDLPRYYGRPTDYADLFAFVRANAAVFDNADSVATLGIAVDPSKPEDPRFRPLIQNLAEKNIPFVLLFPEQQAAIANRIHTVIDNQLTPDLMRHAAVIEVEPSGVVALIRAGRDFTAIHLVNRNTDEFSRVSVVQQFGVRLLQPSFWGQIQKVELLTPHAAPATLTAVPFGRGLRIAVPELRDWAILRLS